jgi:ATP-grasp domain-containing protein
MSPRVLLTTTVRWPSAARLAAAFAQVGAEVEALLPIGHVAGKSRFVARRHDYDPIVPGRSLRCAVARAEPDLVVPCDDRALAHLLNLRAPLLLERSLGRVENYPALMSRCDLIAEARGLGIAAPLTIQVPREADLKAALAHVGLPAVLKVDGSWGGDGVAVARNLAQARAAWRKLAVTPSRPRSVVRALLRRDAHFLRDALTPPELTVSLQRFVPGTPATSAVACQAGRVIASVHMDVLEVVHARGPASVMRRARCPDMERAAHRLAARFGLTGLHGLDFVRDETGQAHLIEMNPRATQAAAFAFGPGHDLAAALVASVSPVIRGPRPVVTENPVIALFPQEWRRDPGSAWLHCAYQDVPWDDPEVLRACLAPGQATPERRIEKRAPVAALTVRQAVGR